MPKSLAWRRTFQNSRGQSLHEVHNLTAAEIRTSFAASIARQIREHNPQAKILFVSEQRSGDVVREALSTGSGYLVKSYAARELFPAMKAVLEGRRFVSASGCIACIARKVWR